MEGYILDTSALSAMVDNGHNNHAVAKAAVAALTPSPIYVSVIALAELMHGIRLYELANGTSLPNADEMISRAQYFPKLEISHHTAAEYAELKSILAVYYLPNVTKTFRKKRVEDWINKFSGKALRVDDNDLWICAQAREFNLTVIADDKMDVIKKGEPRVKLLVV